METLWITSKVCVPIILVGTFFYLCRRRVVAFWRRGLLQKFIPTSFTIEEQILTALSLGYAGFSIAMILLGDAFIKGFLYVGSVGFGTLTFAILPTRYRSFFTFLFSIAIYLGILIGGAVDLRQTGRVMDQDTFLAAGVFFIFLVLIPTAIAWIVTTFRDDKTTS